MPAPRHEDGDDAASVWRLLLGTLWSDDDVRACAAPLLRVSRSMQSVVHAGAAGRLALADRPCVGEEAASAACRWLAQHAVLQQELALEHVQLDALGEEMLAAGLRAAAGAPSMAGGRVTRSRAASPTIKAEACAAAVLQRRSAGEQQQQQQQQQQPAAAGLPLRRVRVSGSFGGTLLRSLASCCPQLTKLELVAANADCLAQPAAAAVSAITALRELRVQMMCRLNCYADTSSDITAMLPDLRPLTQLTRLVAQGRCSTAAAVALPGSLQHLSCRELDADVDLRHLTALEELQNQLGCVREGVKLPASLQRLCVTQLDFGGYELPRGAHQHVAVEAIAPLARLRSLAVLTDCCWQLADAVPQLAGAAPQLSSVEVHALDAECAALAALLAALPQLPVTALTLDYSSECALSDAHLHRSGWEQLSRLTVLTKLELYLVDVHGTAADLAAQLSPLRRLQRLVLSRVHVQRGPFVPSHVDVAPLVAAVVGLTSLTELAILGQLGGMLSGVQWRQLEAALPAGHVHLFGDDDDTDDEDSASF